MSESTGLFRVVADGHYRIAYPDYDVEMTVDRLRRERHELIGELSVACGLLGARAVDGVLSFGTFNLSSVQASASRAKILAERARASKVPWGDMLEELRQRVLAADRHGAPSIGLRDVPVGAEHEEEFDVLGLSLSRRHATITFGDGGTGKSMLALHQLCVLSEMGLRCALFDWEMDAQTHRRRLGAIAGDSMPDVRYVRAERPLIYEVDRLHRIVAKEGIDYAVLDSAGYGTAGAPESAEAAMDYFRAVRHLAIPVNVTAHITKGENGDQRPFGSTFWHNSARATWFLKLASTSPDGQVHQLAAFNRKSNVGRLRPPVGLRLEFSGGRVFFTRIDATTIDEVATSMPLWQRIKGVVQSGPMTLASIAEELKHDNVESIDRVVRRSKNLFTKVTGSDGIARVTLFDRRVS